MHHRQSIPKHEDAGEVARFQNVAPALAFKECQPQEHHDLRRELPRLQDEFLREFVWRVGDDALAAIGRPLLKEEVAP
jgi:hypothetical protein